MSTPNAESATTITCREAFVHDYALLDMYMTANKSYTQAEMDDLYVYFRNWYGQLWDIAEQYQPDTGEEFLLVTQALVTNWYNELSFHEKLTLTNLPIWLNNNLK